MPYYLEDGQKTLGPFSVEDLVARPEFSMTSLIFPVGAEDGNAWKPASEYADVAATAQAPKNSDAPITLTLPPRKSRPAEPIAPPPAPAPAETPVVEPEPLRPLSLPQDHLILIVDDDETVRSLVEMILKSEGYRVATATDGRAAAASLATLSPSLIVTDLMMPGVGGYEFLRSLQDGHSNKIPIIVLTASELDKSTVALIRQEANVLEFMSKPLKVTRFTTLVNKTLGTVR